MGEFPYLKFGIANLINKPNVIDVLESGRSLPLDKIVLETDCHHFVPPGHKEICFQFWTCSECCPYGSKASQYPGFEIKNTK